MKLDRNGYAPSILQEGDYCFLCGRMDRELDRHEVFPGPYRYKSKMYGLWLNLCHYPCHEGPDGAHASREVSRYLKAYAQGRAMETYGWTEQQFRERFGKNYL